MAKINRSIEIRATPEAAFESLINWSALTQWSTVTHSHDGPDRCSGVGEEFDQQLRIAGLPLQTHWRVVDLPGGFLGEAFDRVYVERRNEREVEHSLQNLKDVLEGRKLP